MPGPNDFNELSPARKRAYRAIYILYRENGSSPSLPEISQFGKVGVGNLHPIIIWLRDHGWISHTPKQHRSIVPLVHLPAARKMKTA